MSKSQSHDLPKSALDQILSAQIIVAWAGEAGEDPRLSWWRTDLASEFGGQALFQQLMPATWPWASLQAAREAARKHDAATKAKDAESDRLLTLFSLGFELDEKLDERLQDLKRTHRPPHEALPQLAELLAQPWSRQSFEAWVAGHGEAAFTVAPVGRRLKGAPPQSHEIIVKKLVGGLAPLTDAYALPHFRRSA